MAATNGTLAATAGCGKAPTLASGTRTIQSSGQSRTYILRIPDGYDRNRPYRLIFGFHWLNGSANNVASAGYYGLQPLSNNSTIFVAPQGLNAGWANTNGRDLTLFDDISRQIENDLCVDTTQRFALGWSYGGAMSYAVACARPTVIRAVAVLSGANLSGCNGGTQPVAYFGIHGIYDSVLNISQGRSLRDTFVRNNGCTAQSPREPSRGSLTHITTAYSGCRAGYPGAVGRVRRGPHPQPGRRIVQPQRLQDLDLGGDLEVLQPVRVDHAPDDRHRRPPRRRPPPRRPPPRRPRPPTLRRPGSRAPAPPPTGRGQQLARRLPG